MPDLNPTTSFFQTEIPAIPEPLNLERCTFSIQKEKKEALVKFCQDNDLSRDCLIEALIIFIQANDSVILSNAIIPEALRRTENRALHRLYATARTHAKKLPFEV
jgi:hypothetical protein